MNESGLALMQSTTITEQQNQEITLVPTFTSRQFVLHDITQYDMSIVGAR